MIVLVPLTMMDINHEHSNTRNINLHFRRDGGGGEHFRSEEHGHVVFCGHIGDWLWHNCTKFQNEISDLFTIIDVR